MTKEALSNDKEKEKEELDEIIKNVEKALGKREN